MKRPISLSLACAIAISASGTPLGHAAEPLNLPAPGTMVQLSPAFIPPMLKGIKVHPENQFRFDFILDHIGSTADSGHIKQESHKLIKYFLTSLTIPEKDVWVNLSPYEHDRLVPGAFGQTEMGRDLLAQDYMLKQITASLIYPEDEFGRKFWKRVYEESAKRFGTTFIQINTFNKVWIVPEKAVVFENAKAGTAYVMESKLKVMLEEDYLSLRKHSSVRGEGNAGQTNSIGASIVREVVIPQLTKEINEGRNFARLRQIYNSLILAAWYKKKIKDSILGQVYVNKSKLAGINVNDPRANQNIYALYLEAFKKGVYNFIKEEHDPLTQQRIPRKYFSGGLELQVDPAMVIEDDMTSVPQTNSEQMEIRVRLDQAMNVFNESAQVRDILRESRKHAVKIRPISEGAFIFPPGTRFNPGPSELNMTAALWEYLPEALPKAASAAGFRVTDIPVDQVIVQMGGSVWYLSLSGRPHSWQLADDLDAFVFVPDEFVGDGDLTVFRRVLNRTLASRMELSTTIMGLNAYKLSQLKDLYFPAGHYVGQQSVLEQAVPPDILLSGPLRWYIEFYNKASNETTEPFKRIKFLYQMALLRGDAGRIQEVMDLLVRFREGLDRRTVMSEFEALLGVDVPVFKLEDVAHLVKVHAYEDDLRSESRNAMAGADQASVSDVGGIDLSLLQADSHVQGHGPGIRFQIEPDELRKLENTTGFVPVIINIQPVTNLRLFLGLQAPPH